MKDRIESLKKAFSRMEIDALLINEPKNCMYLSGFTGSFAILLITLQNAYLLTDFRYTEQAGQECPHLDIVEIAGGFYPVLGDLLARDGACKFGAESDYLTYQEFYHLKEKIGEYDCKVVPVADIVKKLRAVKDTGEVNAVQNSMQILDRALEYISDKLYPGRTERDVSLDLEFFTRKNGAEENAFPFIVASGTRSSLPHGIASDKVLENGELVTIDFGVHCKDYASDMTRTVVLGKPGPKQEEIYNIVLEAQQTGLDAVKDGVRASDVDRAARAVIEKHGYGQYFGHSTGHGVGLDVHESPRLSQNSSEVLEENMIVTVEPGIYIPGWGGVRIEDTLVVQKDGCRILCSSPKDKLIKL
ncbi:MAG: aminopeptidase P family protein [Clostridiales bacterium]|nr:aminopeptidase P family protein [Clostridiales bacterium]MCF8021164.1 aminopeptidase P family protein [Clostridiales bacterium]